MKELLAMKIRKIKWGFFSIIDRNGKEVAVASSWSKANKIIKKLTKKASDRE